MDKIKIDNMWGRATQTSISNNDMFTRYEFAKMVADRCCDILMHEIHMDHSDVHDLEQRVCDQIEVEFI